MSNRHLIGRRQFLAVSSAGVVMAAVAGPKLFASDAAAPRRLAIGYASLEENARVVDGSSVPAADGGFIGRGARVHVTGANVVSKEPRARRTIGVIAHFSYFDGAERKTTPFTAWAASRVTGGAGSASAFTMPVDEVQKLAFTFDAESGTPRGAATRRDALSIETSQTSELPLTLSLQNEPGALKLARGFYIIVPVFEGDSDPRWSAYAMREREGRWTLVDSEDRVAPFEHFVLKIDYAPQS